jgi:CBS-domain-containing membrane protein
MEAAHELMQQRGVRLLLAIDADGTLAGIITASDILGEKPMHLVHERRIHHSDLLVSDVMTPAARLDAFDWKAVQAARVGNVVARLRLARRQHALVTQTLDGQVQVRGIISLSQIARQLGIALQLPEAADSFAEIEAALVAL